MMASKSDADKASQQTAQTCRFGPEDASGVARLTPFASFISPHVDGSPRICELVEYYLEDVLLKGAWTGPAALSLVPHALAPIAELPVLVEVVSAVPSDRSSNVDEPRSGSKQALLIRMLSRKSGATLEAMVEATGWLPHTTRAALTCLRKRGYSVLLERQDGKPSVYRIASGHDRAAA